MSYKRLTPCIFIDGGKAVQWFDETDSVHLYRRRESSAVV